MRFFTPCFGLFSSTLLLLEAVAGFVATPTRNHQSHGQNTVMYSSTLIDTRSEEIAIQKAKLFDLLNPKDKQIVDPVLADPITKQPITITIKKSSKSNNNYGGGVLLGGEFMSSSFSNRKDVEYELSSPTNKYKGSSKSFINLLEPIIQQSNNDSESVERKNSFLGTAIKRALPLIPAPLRSTVGNALTRNNVDIIPMRDLFTSPTVSFAYERGWRQNFAVAGFPGPDTEAQMAMDYFAPVIARSNDKVVVDMSCATGLFTRRFATSKNYNRVLGCDYSESMLQEARRRIEAESITSKVPNTQLDLVRLDVGQIPMQSESVDCINAGAAMHCWPDLDAAASELYRVLKPGGRYFATTFLSTYFQTLRAIGDSNTGNLSTKAFQYFESADTLRSLLERGGFEPSKISIEILGEACIVIRCEK